MESQLDLPRGLQGPCKSRRPQGEQLDTKTGLFPTGQDLQRQ